jgi:hypothetical protein
MLVVDAPPVAKLSEPVVKLVKILALPVGK